MSGKTKEKKKLRDQIAMDSQRHKRGKHPLRQAYCGAKTKSTPNGSPCKKPAGWGTDHPGFGTCRWHGGMAAGHRKKAFKDKAILMGAPKEINPVDALYWCIKITAGEVEWLSEQIKTLDKKDWYEDTVLGKQMHLLARERKEAVERLAQFSRVAISLGLAERAVRLAENYGVALSRLLGGILDDLGLDQRQRQIAPIVVRKHLILLEGGNPSGGEVRQQPKALEAGSDNN